DEGVDLAAEELPAWLACSQSLYWAQQGGVNCSGLELLYFYHSDYLGSVEFVTNNLSRLYGGMRGEAYQLARTAKLGGFASNYTAFGSRFRFNPPPLLRFRAGPLPQSRFRAGGKEWEGQALRNRPVAYFSAGARLPRWRGNYYYGARYVVYPERSLGDPKISVWLSVDPLASEFPGWSPYNFTMNNPLNLVDPDGLSAKPPVNVEDFFDPGNTWDDDDGSWVLSDDYEWIPQGNTPYEGSTLPELEIDGGSKPVSANAEEKSETSNETQPNSFDRKSQPSVSIKVSLGSYPTPFADFSLSAKQKVQESQNSAVGITLDRDGELQSTSWTTVFGTQTINMDGGVSTSYGGVSTGFNNKNQMTIGISSPSFQGRSYSASMSMNPRQFANSAFLAMNLIAFRRFPSSPLFPAFVP
ncbi:MAG: hypothetical protein NXI09_15790, partial [Bacteroidetes bacterium]|nr:hypothetical protein [Bacteroidota bacterium]